MGWALVVVVLADTGPHEIDGDQKKHEGGDGVHSVFPSVGLIFGVGLVYAGKHFVSVHRVSQGKSSGTH